MTSSKAGTRDHGVPKADCRSQAPEKQAALTPIALVIFASGGPSASIRQKTRQSLRSKAGTFLVRTLDARMQGEIHGVHLSRPAGDGFRAVRLPPLRQRI